MNGLAALSLCAAALQAAPEAERPQFVTGKALLQALSQPFAATWEHVNLRTIARRIGATRGTAILLDRRLDPSHEHSLSAGKESLHEFLDDLAARVGGRTVVVENTVYLGPPEAADKLRTLIALRQRDLAADVGNISRARRIALSQPVLFAWDDLTPPMALLKRLGEQNHLEFDRLDLVPHDLWAGSELPQATPIAVLSLILIQFDLTFEWINSGAGIRIVPVPSQVAIERRHPPARGQTAAAAVTQWKAQYPGLEARVSGGEVLVTGTAEQHEAIERERLPARPGSASPGGSRLGPLKLERYTLHMQDKPVRALLQMLSEPAYGQLTFEFDAEALKQAGINLDQRVTFEVKTATIEELLKAALGPMKVEFELHDRTVRLRPAK